MWGELFNLVLKHLFRLTTKQKKVLNVVLQKNILISWPLPQTSGHIPHISSFCTQFSGEQIQTEVMIVFRVNEKNSSHVFNPELYHF